MSTFFQPVPLAARSCLSEVLYWVAFQRLPIDDPPDPDDAGQIGVAGADLGEMYQYIWPDETERAGLPLDPRCSFLSAGNVYIPVKLYDEILSQDHIAPALRKQRSFERDAIRNLEREYSQWRPLYERVVEYPRSKIFVALTEGRLAAFGRRLPAEIRVPSSQVSASRRDALREISFSEIPPSFWSLKGIDFESNCASNSQETYWDIYLITEEVLKVFPGSRERAEGIARIGIGLVADDTAPRLSIRDGRRGRPSFPWDGFHLEVTDLIVRNEMPDKKEAAIAYFQNWFEERHRFRPSRAAVGEKLKPYFDKFVKEKGQKR